MLVVVFGIVQLARGRATDSLREGIFEDTSTSPSVYALVLYSDLWAIDGWDQANYVASEMRDATKNIPRAIHLSMFTVLVSIKISLAKILFEVRSLVFIHLDERRVFRGP